ncbi:MAG: hypothetical protein JSU65_13565 [Candidatus Zixiibacteriota bacterium]|nr:MAG: hypothetical protein JSU65_13565 [candidate division Zixibacteria bacterium]
MSICELAIHESYNRYDCRPPSSEFILSGAKGLRVNFEEERLGLMGAISTANYEPTRWAG